MRTIQIPAYGTIIVFHRGEWIDVQTLGHCVDDTVTLGAHIVTVDIVRELVAMARHNEHLVVDTAAFGTEI